jgi:hypothetical protein
MRSGLHWISIELLCTQVAILDAPNRYAQQEPVVATVHLNGDDADVLLAMRPRRVLEASVHLRNHYC